MHHLDRYMRSVQFEFKLTLVHREGPTFNQLGQAEQRTEHTETIEHLTRQYDKWINPFLEIFVGKELITRLKLFKLYFITYLQSDISV